MERTRSVDFADLQRHGFHEHRHRRALRAPRSDMCVSVAGLSFSETVLVTEGGAERLTRSERVLFVR